MSGALVAAGAAKGKGSKKPKIGKKATGATAESKPRNKKEARQAKRAKRKEGRKGKGVGKRIGKALLTGGASEVHRAKKKAKKAIKKGAKGLVKKGKAKKEEIKSKVKSKVEGAKTKVKSKVKAAGKKVETAVKKKVNKAATAVAGATAPGMYGGKKGDESKSHRDYEGPSSYDMSVPGEKLKYIQQSSGKYDNAHNIGGPRMTGEKYDMKEAYNDNMSKSARFNYLKNAMHDKKGGSALSKHFGRNSKKR